MKFRSMLFGGRKENHGENAPFIFSWGSTPPATMRLLKGGKACIINSSCTGGYSGKLKYTLSGKRKRGAHPLAFFFLLSAEKEGKGTCLAFPML